MFSKTKIACVAAAVLWAGAVSAQDAGGSPEVQALYEAARAEGSVVIWGTQAKEVDWIPAAFGEAFPGITVEVLGDNDIATKAITEARGGRHAVDVFQTSVNASLPVQERGLFTENDWSIFGIAPDRVLMDGQFGLSHTSAYSLVWNTDLVDGSTLPDSWLELAAPEYAGKMTGSLFLLPRMIGAIGVVEGEEAALGFARDLMDSSDILLTRAPRETFLQSGERAIAVGEIDQLARVWMQQGLPVDYKILEPVVVSQFGVSVMANAPHPNAAKLLAGFLVSPEGRAARAKATDQFDYRPGTTDEMPASLHERGLKFFYDTPEVAAEHVRLIDAIAPILAGQAR